MSAATKPIFDTDFSKFVDPSKLNFPSVNVEAVWESQRKNAAAFASAGRTAMENAQAIVQRQADIVRQNLESMTSAAQSVLSAQNPSERAIKQTEATKEALVRFMESAKELTDTVARSHCEVIDAVGHRATEFLDECQSFMKKSSE